MSLEQKVHIIATFDHQSSESLIFSLMSSILLKILTLNPRILLQIISLLICLDLSVTLGGPGNNLTLIVRLNLGNVFCFIRECQRKTAILA